MLVVLRVRPSRAFRSVAILVLALSLSAVEGACLSPQDIEVEQTPVKPHLPPTFDVTKDVTPDEPIVCLSSLDSGPTEFRVDNIQDPTGQALHARFFYDYEDGNTAYVDDQEISPSPGGTVAKPAVLESNDIGQSQLASIGHPFFIEVVVSDGFDDAANAEPKYRALLPGAFALTYRWSVEYLVGSPCPESP